jgi:hypothetical protein
MGTWADGTWALTFWEDGTWEEDPVIPPLGDNTIPTGVKINEFGAVYTVLVAQDFAGAPGDVFIEGVRHTADGAMYITSDLP